MATASQLGLPAHAVRVLQARFLRKDASGTVIETPDDMFRRVAAAVAAAETVFGATNEQRTHWEGLFYELMRSLRFLPNSPTLMNAGTELQQLSACFVLPVGDSMDGIFDAVKHTALIHKSGGGTGFSFSRIRPKNDVVRTTHGVSSGPVSFMEVFDAATETVKQGGKRRGANMAILRVDHPDILEFIDAKTTARRLNNFNLSVALTEAFMDALANDASYDLINPRTGVASATLRASDVFASIVDHAWRNGEPGIVYIDRMDGANPTPAAGPIESTNPCGEQPLLPYESCNLGSLNLARFVVGEVGQARVDEAGLRAAAGLAVRFLDNVIEVNHYPLPEIDGLTRANRKIGLGVMGFADSLIAMGIPYDSERAGQVAEGMMQIVNDAAVDASQQLARERGAFPNFSDSVFGRRGDAPRRNATVTTVAPTGSISIVAGASSGVEPLFALAFKRRVLDGAEWTEVHPLFEQVARCEGFYSEDLLDRVTRTGRIGGDAAVPHPWPEIFQTAHDVSPAGHVRIQAAFQRHTENAVSKTVNLPRTASPSDVERVFRLAYQSGCKGVTVYRDGSRAAQVLSTESTDAATRELRLPVARPETLTGRTVRKTTGCGNLYVTTNESAHGPLELFAHIGKTGGCAASQTEAIGRLVSLALRSGVDPRAVAKQLRGVRCPFPSWNHGHRVLSCADGIGQVLDEIAGGSDAQEPGARAERLAGMCVDCGNVLEYEGGCVVCRACGYTRC